MVSLSWSLKGYSDGLGIGDTGLQQVFNRATGPLPLLVCEQDLGVMGVRHGALDGELDKTGLGPLRAPVALGTGKGC